MSLPPNLGTLASPAILPPMAGPSKATATSNVKQPDHCKLCFGGLGRKYPLEFTEDNLLACSRCGIIDERATHARNIVSVSDTTGAQLHQHELLRTFERDWTEFESRAEKSFKVSSYGFCFEIMLNSKRTNSTVSFIPI